MRKVLVVFSILVGLFSTVAFGDTVAPAPLKGVGTYVPSYDQTQIRLSWKANLESDVIGYNVYVNGVRQNTGALVTVAKPSYFTSSYQYYIWNLTKGKYEIKVTVVDSSGNESLPFSTVVFLR